MTRHRHRLARALLPLLAVAGILTFTAAPSFADGSPPSPAVIAATNEATATPAAVDPDNTKQDVITAAPATGLTIAANPVALFLTFAMPVFVAVATKQRLNDTVKGVLTIVLSAAIVLVRRSQIDGGAAFVSTQALFDTAVTAGVATLSYLGLWGTEAIDVNARLAPEFGIGPRSEPVRVAA